MKKTALGMIQAGIDAVLPERIMASVSWDGSSLVVGERSFPAKKRVFVIGGGKASGKMAECIERIIGPDAISDGVVSCKDGIYTAQKIRIRHAGHPSPDGRGVKAVEEMLALKGSHDICEGDLVIFLISGGGSSLMPCPAEGVTLEDKQAITNLLLGSGAEIGEINAVRKHLSRIKGGRLGEFFSPATVVSLILSDVIGNRLDVIASGPTVPDTATFRDAMDVLERHGLVDAAPKRVLDHIRRGLAGDVPETPKSLVNCHNFILGDNKLALDAVSKHAQSSGWNPVIVHAELKGDPTIAAKEVIAQVRAGEFGDKDCIILGGETAPKLPENPGTGGRNQHIAAVSMVEMEGFPGEWVVASAGTDGSDFLPDIAGGIVDQDSAGLCRAANLDIGSHLANFDSFPLLEASGGLIRTGPTGTNVCDIMVILFHRSG